MVLASLCFSLSRYLVHNRKYLFKLHVSHFVIVQHVRMAKKVIHAEPSSVYKTWDCFATVSSVDMRKIAKEIL